MLLHTIINAKTQEESNTAVLSDFPYRADSPNLHELPRRTYPWHWHSDVEFFYLESGSIEYRIPGESVIFEAGEAGFLNGDILHSTKTVSAENCEEIVHIFLPSFLSGGAQSLIDTKYIFPLQKNKGITIVKFPKDSKECKTAIEAMRTAFALFYRKEFGYEAKIRSLMMDLWLLTLTFCRKHGMKEVRETADSKRIKRMAAFIDAHFFERLTLFDIAKSADIGERECCRCFARQLKTSPLDYLTDIRTGKARELLLTTNDAIEIVAEKCGFSSGGYFCKVFKKRTGFSPRQFRSSEKSRNAT